MSRTSCSISKKEIAYAGVAAKNKVSGRGIMQPDTSHIITYVRGWTPWGVPCSVKFVDGERTEASCNGHLCECTRLRDEDGDGESSAE